MHCPFCTNTETQVKDSRATEDGEAIRRRRYCSSCDSRFTTFERVQLREIIVVKKNGERKIFDRDKLQSSIEMAVRKRHIDRHRVESLVNKIIRDLETEGINEISTINLGEKVMKSLRLLDKVAFVRFASVYKNFESAQDFTAFIKEIT